MSAENKKVVRPDESRNSNLAVDKSRRSFSKAGVVAPVIMTLTSKTALGGVYQCTISGIQSGNQSSHPGDYDCGVGFSPGGWRQNAVKTGNQDGNLNQWCLASVNPFTIRRIRINGSYVKQVSYKGEWKSGGDWTEIYNTIKTKFGSGALATTFQFIFGSSSFGDTSMWDMLDKYDGSLEFHAIADYLNAALNQATGAFNPVYEDITPAYIVSIYNSTTLSATQKKEYFELIHH
ncbi:hypothetical protein IVG45_21270 [Methylomonas sp. LL1]|uniref:hypothetical protein n=1 Tax=Methylomonas sp. LL1 TaxID=2785785 RepID=UPI0018C373C5|nr:hypothetical protein [Methylomonas sp. LL1]QPK63300.1 hypothetical protein IVG45_21270 [Methylomonas sp. LL1]